MKMKLMQILLTSFVAASTQAAYPLLTIGNYSPCWDSTSSGGGVGYSKFTLPGVNGDGVLLFDPLSVHTGSGASAQEHFLYGYSVDLSGMSAPTTHCIKLVIHFGQPLGCSHDVLLANTGLGMLDPTTAGLGPFGDITFLFGSGCLSPGQTTSELNMLSDSPPTPGSVTIIDDYTDPFTGLTNQTRVNVTTFVPDIPPNWTTVPPSIPDPRFQGILYTNNYPAPSNGQYSLIFQLMDAPVNGLPSSQAYTQTVQVVNGLFTVPLHFNPSVYNANPNWLSMSVKPAGSSTYTPLNPPLPLTPTPQAMYAYSAGVVANLSPGQAVTCLNGLTGPVVLEPGMGITLGTNGNTLTISSVIGSDRNMKKDFAPVDPRTVLDQLVALPLQRWRYLNEDERTGHLGPMAQDFRSTFGLGSDDKSIGLVDASGVALAAIQGLNDKVEERSHRLEAENAELKHSVQELKRLVETLVKKGNE